MCAFMYNVLLAQASVLGVWSMTLVLWLPLGYHYCNDVWTLPEGEEDDGFDREKLGDRLEGREERFGGRVEEK